MSSNKVFFLGAGFSKAINPAYPLMGALSKQTTDKLADKKDILDRYYREDIAAHMKDNIEDLLTYLSSDFPFKDDVQRVTNLALYQAIVQILSDVFLELEKKRNEPKVIPNSSECSTALGKYIEKHKGKIIDGKENIHFITLNYDEIIEDAVQKAFRKDFGKYPPTLTDIYKYPMLSVGARAGFNPLVDFPRILHPTVLKLHGSVNWYWHAANPYSPIYCDSPDMNSPKDWKAGLIPYIVPPVLDKNAFYNHVALKVLWHEAHKLLKNADEIYIVGFSFPLTDLPVKFLFQSALRDSKAKVYIINAAAETELRKNYDIVFKGTMSGTVDYKFTGSTDALLNFLS